MKLVDRLAFRVAVTTAVLVGLALFVAERRATSRVTAIDGLYPSPAVSEALISLRLEFVIMTFVVFVLSFVCARFVVQPLTQPIEELRDDARAIATGDLSRRPSIADEGEAGELAAALRLLADRSANQTRALVAEQALLVALSESLNEGVIAVDPRNQIVRINEKARQLFRLRDAVPFSSDYLPRDRTLRETLATAMKGGDATPGEVTVDEHVLSLTARPLESGGALLAFYDLTPFRRLEAVRRDFVANVSHELRTPLTVISGFVETLSDDDVPPDLRKQFLGMTASNVRRMQRIVDDLLDLSRIESGGWIPNPTELDVRAIAAEVVTPIADAATAKGVKLEIAIGEDARTVYADSTAVRQVWSNLAENALRHTVRGSVVLFSESRNDGVWLGVRDTGIGISEVHLPRIFERFYRADPSRSREAGGTGLGLAIVRHLAEAHGGSVRASSVVDHGTEIAAWFPPNENDA